MMQTKVRKLGGTEWMHVEHEPGDCPACAFAHQFVKWVSPGIVFVDLGSLPEVRRVECLFNGDRVSAFHCELVTQSDAIDEIARNQVAR